MHGVFIGIAFGGWGSKSTVGYFHIFSGKETSQKIVTSQALGVAGCGDVVCHSVAIDLVDVVCASTA